MRLLGWLIVIRHESIGLVLRLIVERHVLWQAPSWLLTFAMRATVKRVHGRGQFDRQVLVGRGVADGYTSLAFSMFQLLQ
jgi:hypothetical protein